MPKSPNQVKILEIETEPLLKDHLLINKKEGIYQSIETNSVDSLLKSSETCSTDIELDNIRNELKKH